MATPNVLIPMSDYGHDPTGETPPSLRIRVKAHLQRRDRSPIYCIQEGWIPGSIRDREWQDARMRQEDAARRYSKATCAGPAAAHASET